jgi:hypothetical protein
LVLKIHEDLGFDEIVDSPEKIIHDLSNINSRLYFEDILRYLIPEEED